MYNNQAIKSKKIEKESLNKALFVKDVDFLEYYASLTPYQKLIFKYMFSFRSKKFICLLNHNVAKEVGCNRITVIRATNKFLEDGIILKLNKHKFDPNKYFLHPKLQYGSKSVSFWKNIMLDKTQQDFYLSTQAIIYKNPNKHLTVKQRENSYVSINIKQRNVTLTSSNIKYIYIYTPLRRLPVNFDSNEMSLNKKLFNGESMFTETQQNWILRTKDLDKTRDVLTPIIFNGINTNEKEFKSLSFEEQFNIYIQQVSPSENHNKTVVSNVRKAYHYNRDIRKKIYSLIKCDYIFYLKMFVFSESILELAYKVAQNILNNPSNIRQIADKPSWFMSICTSLSKKQNQVLNWRIFFKLCDVFKIEARSSLKRKAMEFDNNTHYKTKSPNGKDIILKRQYPLYQGSKTVVPNPHQCKDNPISFAEGINNMLSELDPMDSYMRDIIALAVKINDKVIN